jgi:solute carrier family 25 protein 39/40
MFLQILRSEGGWHLWRGLGPTLMMSIPSTVIYFNMYDELKTSFGNSQFSPLFAGVFARVIAVTLVAPIELIRTRTQAVRGGKDTQVFKSSLQTLSEEVRALGPRALFRGLSSTLWRDIPFSGIYWLGYEKIKAMLKDDYKWEGTFKVSFASGAASGMFTALVTTPFDVVKTRQQVEMMQILRDQANKEAKVHNGTTPFFKLLTSIYQQEGISGLFAGTAARLSKVAPACAIMISSYEMFKSHFSTRNNSI